MQFAPFVFLPSLNSGENGGIGNWYTFSFSLVTAQNWPKAIKNYESFTTGIGSIDYPHHRRAARVAV
jgi:hypothetical protein